MAKELCTLSNIGAMIIITITMIAHIHFVL